MLRLRCGGHAVVQPVKRKRFLELFAHRGVCAVAAALLRAMLRRAAPISRSRLGLVFLSELLFEFDERPFN